MIQKEYPLEENSFGKQHIILMNVEGKKWIFPIDNVKVGMNIYQPSSFQGKTVKKLLPYVTKWQFILNKLHISVENMKLQDDVMLYLRHHLGEQVEYSIFYGTPSPNQKITMQINQGKKCIAYVKFSDKEHIAEYFQREYSLLKELEVTGMQCIPKAIAFQKIGKYYVFVQSGEKTGREKEADKFYKAHINFLDKMYEHSKVTKSFEDTKYYKNLMDLQNCLERFESKDRDIIHKGIDKISRVWTNETEFYLYHGDFTPWNMYLKEDMLHVFDFEYAKREYPKYLDVFHFHTQIWNLVERRDMESIWNLYQRKNQEWAECLQIDNIDVYYIAYLLDIIHENLLLESIANEKIDEGCYKLWLYLLERLNAK